ncbi:high frequency lysogenization protein HflD [Thiomicrospira sp. WB1]|jgi:high frequency lysogenization protein|uniref:high frequency lysogenization protein HflD n=1 Tax=Thiomicrospira sp. WB1 TaxID=1685380 RepID=UPI000746A0DC|nr:high frequency lysogenization protein HflD [Thiomicrospira sp. WB1]KUJ71956.1 High frequency lysogenization protein hflD [Thiomicrospira sp. WB1]
MSNAYTFHDKAIALSGIYQAAQLVFELATTGQASQRAYEVSIDSLYCDNPDQTLDVYGGDVANIQTGVLTLLNQMNGAQATTNRNIEVTKYVLSLMILEKNVSKKGVLDKVARTIDSSRTQRNHFGDYHENVIATLARAYSENISQINPRIMVNGQHGHLQNPKVANKIRALLLAGLRAALLWRQVGGTRWGLLLSRKKYLQAVQALHRPETSASDDAPNDTTDER